MRTTLLVAGHHVRRLVKNPALVLILLAIPVSLAAIEYAAFGRTVASGKLPPIKVLLLDEDQSLVSRLVPQLFAAGPMRGQFDLETVTDWTSVRARFQANSASALVVGSDGISPSCIIRRCSTSDGGSRSACQQMCPLPGRSGDSAPWTSKGSTRTAWGYHCVHTPLGKRTPIHTDCGRSV